MSLRSLRLATHAFEIWLAVAAIVSGVSYFLGTSSVAVRALQAVSPNLTTAFSVSYAAGGVLVLAGLWRGVPSVEGAGLSLLVSGIMISAFGLLAVLGSSGTISATLQLGAAVACLVRLRLLHRGQ